ncbi:26S proteasome non-ATPase regulatory subunit 11 [Platysternon megacephalum]|uniref:26S proteasome non-ATPase regulatory subunit 11 n=1 Tax=Platysternon megacephalum TaxID=55544 RepID=A0A4D9E4W8_9SAUR|nr:26S proteasome non-ATPase regulatory subunit 11 [Platysternon megacephalum]
MGYTRQRTSHETKSLGEDPKVEENEKGVNVEHDLANKEGLWGGKNTEGQKDLGQDQVDVDVESNLDPKYVIIGVTLGVFLAIGFLALKICMIKRQLIDNDFVDSDNRVDKRSITHVKIQTQLKTIVHPERMCTYIPSSG